MSKFFKSGELVEVVSLPWRGYGDKIVKVGSLVVIDHMRPTTLWGESYAVLREMLAAFPSHSIGTRNLRSTGLRISKSRNKREGIYLGKSKGRVVRALRIEDRFDPQFHRTPSKATAYYHLKYTARRFAKHAESV